MPLTRQIYSIYQTFLFLWWPKFDHGPYIYYVLSLPTELNSRERLSIRHVQRYKANTNIVFCNSANCQQMTTKISDTGGG